MTAIFAIVKRLLASNKISFIITALVVLCATSSGDVVLSNGNYTWLIAVLTPFFFVFYDFTKLMHLGASKKDYFFGCLISYGFLAFCISLVNTVIHLSLIHIWPVIWTRFMQLRKSTVCLSRKPPGIFPRHQ